MKYSLIFVLAGLVIMAVACPLITSTTPSKPAIPSLSPPVQPPAQPQPSPTRPLASPVAPIPTSTPLATETEAAPPTLLVQPAAPVRLASGNHLELDEIHMVSLTEGWGIQGPLLLVTDDGAMTWREVTPNAAPADMLSGVFFDRQTAWVIFSNGGQIDPNLTVYFTRDGGQTWSTNQAIPLDTPVSGETTWPMFALLDANNLWMMVRGVSLGAGTHYSHALFRTSDGGLTWSPLDGEISDDYTGMVFSDPQDGLRTLQTTGFYGPSAPAYDITSDAGATWTGQELPPPSDAPELFNQYPYCETYQPVFLSQSSIHLLVGCFDDQNPPVQFASYLYSSSQAGAAWTTVRMPEKIQASLDTLVYFDPQHALLLGRDIYQTADGGQTWSFVQTVYWDGQFSFVDPQHGWAVVHANGQTALVQTANGGKSWSVLKPIVK